MLSLLFFFQAEDGIRYSSVTGVQTCALPIFLLAVSLIVDAFAQPDAAKVEPKHRKTKGGERLHRVVNHLVVHRAASVRVRMAHQRCVGGVGASGIEKILKAARWTAKIIARFNL